VFFNLRYDLIGISNLIKPIYIMTQKNLLNKNPIGLYVITLMYRSKDTKVVISDVRKLFWLPASFCNSWNQTLICHFTESNT
jgi:hypothetical protein